VFVKVGNVRVTCTHSCSTCPMETSPVGWKKLTEAPCCEKMWIPAGYLSQATAKDKTINKGKATKLFLRDLGVL